MDDLTSYTIEEIAELLKVEKNIIETEVESGKLAAFMIGGQWRITRKSLADFIAQGGSRPIIVKPLNNVLSEVGTNKTEPFQYTWPDGKTEEYSEAYEGIVDKGDAHFEYKVGVCERFAAGQKRKRVTVFINGRPTVEFVGTNDFRENKKVASLITLPNKKRLKPTQAVPNEYRSFNIVRYNSVVIGPRAANTMAVLTNIDDIDSMVAHAIIRANYRDNK